MSNTKHTAGPWKRLYGGRPGVFNRIAKGGDGVEQFTAGVICDVVCLPKDWGSHEANANLIAAAPDLLEALEELEKLSARGFVPKELIPVYRKMHAAISKARGES